MAVLSGTYLALFFDPSMEEVTYDGVAENLRGVLAVPVAPSLRRGAGYGASRDRDGTTRPVS